MRKIGWITFFAVIGSSIGIKVNTITKKTAKKSKSRKKHIPYGPYEAIIKRILDIVLSGTALFILSPVFGLIALMVRIKLGNPIFFVQKRPGLEGKVFKIYKYRTMTDKKDENGNLLPDEKRLTKFGQLLRSSSLDELPELINILKGDMSIVGPRPLLVEYLERYNDEQKHRHDIRPGLTGYAQVSGRNNLSWDEKFKDDLKYIKKITFYGDLKIILKTIKIVFKRDGIHAEGNATMPEFMG